MDAREKVFALIFYDAKNKNDHAQIKSEFLELAEACDMDVVLESEFKIKVPNNATYLGSGNVDLIASAVDTVDVDTVIVNVGLTGSQIRNLQKIIKKPVIDKNMVLLQIFSKRARSAEAKARVEVANLNYMMSRMVGSYEDLGRQGGRGSKNRGLGETKLELDRRHIQKRISLLKKQLGQYESQRVTQRKQRSNEDEFKVALVGYTNAGKSSLFNTMLSDSTKHVLAQDMVFASLDTVARRVQHGKKYYIIHDTVGYIEDLPKTLYPAFQSTRDELEDADLILHVIDRSSEHYERKEAVIDAYLESMDVGDVPVWKVYSKIDLIPETFENTANTFYISTHDTARINALIQAIFDLSYPLRS